MALAAEVVTFRRGEKTGLSTRPLRKKHKRNPASDEDLRGALDGVRVYVTHCKDNMAGDFDKPMRDIIVPQVRTLVEGKGLGAQILAVEQGMRIGASSFPSAPLATQSRKQRYDLTSVVFIDCFLHLIYGLHLAIDDPHKFLYI